MSGHITLVEEVERVREENEMLRRAIREALNELGVPGLGYPAPVANAVVLLNRALDPGECKHEWETRRCGGPPDDAYTYEMVTVCKECGESKY